MVDPYNRLRMEYNSIRSVIDSYTEGGITCYLDGLKEAIDTYKKEDILYYLEKINKWYRDNIAAIQSNEYVYESNQREHVDAKKFLEEIFAEIKDYDFNLIMNKSSGG